LDARLNAILFKAMEDGHKSMSSRDLGRSVAAPLFHSVPAPLLSFPSFCPAKHSRASTPSLPWMGRLLQATTLDGSDALSLLKV